MATDGLQPIIKQGRWLTTLDSKPIKEIIETCTHLNRTGLSKTTGKNLYRQIFNKTKRCIDRRIKRQFQE